MSVLRLTRNGKTESIPLNRTMMTIGRGAECQIVVADAAAARQHCQVVMTEKGFLVRDLSGQGGTVVNGKKVREQVLRDGDTIQIGAARYQFSAPAAAKPGAGTSTRSLPMGAKPGGTTTRAIPRPAATTPGTGTTAAQRPAGAATGTIPKPAAAGTRPIEKVGGATTGSIPKGGSPGTATLKAKPPAGAGGTAKIATGQISQSAPAGTSTRRTLPARGGGATTHMRMASKRAAIKRQRRTILNLPVTRKGRTLFAGVAFGLLAVIGVLGWFWLHRIDPEAIKAELKERFEKDVKGRPPDEIIKADEELHKILDEERYKKYATVEVRDIRRFHDTGFHEKSELQKKADAAIAPAMKELDALRQRPDELRRRAAELYDNIKSLRDDYRPTTWGEKLSAVVEELQKIMEKDADPWEKKWLYVKRDAEEAARDGDLLKALKGADAFGAEFHESEKADLAGQLKGLRDSCRRLADTAVGKVVAEADALIGKKEFDKAKAAIEAARPGVKGTPLDKRLDDALKKVEDERKKKK